MAKVKTDISREQKKIKKRINIFIIGKGKNKGRKPDERYSSFDYCFNYFHDKYKSGSIQEIANDENMQASCMQLGFYLASWGMLRNSFLLERSLAYYKPIIKTISTADQKLWEIDVDKYTDDNVNLMLEFKKEINSSFRKNDKPSETLISKIMLGVFANTPAFDQFFKKSLQVSGLNRKALRKIKEFYERNQLLIDSYHIRTFEFNSGIETNNYYSKAKIIDMYGFSNGKET